MTDPFFPAEHFDHVPNLGWVRKFGIFEATPVFPSSFGCQTKEATTCI
jgi:hypothetical protein